MSGDLYMLSGHNILLTSHPSNGILVRAALPIASPLCMRFEQFYKDLVRDGKTRLIDPSLKWSFLFDNLLTQIVKTIFSLLAPDLPTLYDKIHIKIFSPSSNTQY